MIQMQFCANSPSKMPPRSCCWSPTDSAACPMRAGPNWSGGHSLPEQARERVRVRVDGPHRPRHHARQRALAPGAVRIRPLQYEIGRGVLEALGVGLSMTPRDVAARANFATLDKGLIVDRRAGRPATEKSRELCALLSKAIPGSATWKSSLSRQGASVHRPVPRRRPRRPRRGRRPAEGRPSARSGQAARAGSRAHRRPRQRLHPPGDRGARRPPPGEHRPRARLREVSADSEHDRTLQAPAGLHRHLPDVPRLAKLVGMKILEPRETIEDEFNTLSREFEKHDFFYIHIKKTDSYGEDGNFDKKVEIIEELDRHVRRCSRWSRTSSWSPATIPRRRCSRPLLASMPVPPLVEVLPAGWRVAFH